MSVPPTINKILQRRFILGKQGLWPGRRWCGKEGVLAALHADCTVQIDPLQVIARNHDLTLQARVIDYSPGQLDALLYEDRACLEYGGIVRIYPIEELPYLGVVMARNGVEARWGHFLENHKDAIERVRKEVRERGALSSMDIEPGVTRKTSWWSGKDTGRALYYLWICGELLIRGRKGNGKVFDLRERLVPRQYTRVTTPARADDFYALKTFRQLNLAREGEWRQAFAGLIERKVSQEEARERLNTMERKGLIRPVLLKEDPKAPRYLLAEDWPLLQKLKAGRIPDAWQPLETTTEQEVTILAPLEIVSARKRAEKLFDFDYVWEVYKPADKRRWGYYTLPILYGDRLVARFDAKLDRTANALQLKGFWLEEGQKMSRGFTAALKRGFRRFLTFAGAERILPEAGISPEIVELFSRR